MEELERFPKVSDQFGYRKQLVKDELSRMDIPFEFDAIIGRGHLAKPVSGGVYEINEKMVEDAKNALHQHACDLGCIISFELAKEVPGGCRSFTADPGVVDELCDEARICGSPLMQRICIWHALNQRAIARRFAAETGRRYEDLNLIICHLGGGISIAAHHHGKAIDANNALDGEGPFSPERAGSLPAADLIRLCFSGKYTEDQLLKRVAGQAGLIAHLGTNDMREVTRRANEGDEQAKAAKEAFLYQVSKDIGSMACVLEGKVDQIILTGGIAYGKDVCEAIEKRCGFIAPFTVYPGEDELLALAQGGLRVLRGEEEAKQY